MSARSRLFVWCVLRVRVCVYVCVCVGVCGCGWVGGWVCGCVGVCGCGCVAAAPFFRTKDPRVSPRGPTGPSTRLLTQCPGQCPGQDSGQDRAQDFKRALCEGPSHSAQDSASVRTRTRGSFRVALARAQDRASVRTRVARPRLGAGGFRPSTRMCRGTRGGGRTSFKGDAVKESVTHTKEAREEVLRRMRVMRITVSRPMRRRTVRAQDSAQDSAQDRTVARTSTGPCVRTTRTYRAPCRLVPRTRTVRRRGRGTRPDSHGLSGRFDI